MLCGVAKQSYPSDAGVSDGGSAGPGMMGMKHPISWGFE